MWLWVKKGCQKNLLVTGKMKKNSQFLFFLFGPLPSTSVCSLFTHIPRKPPSGWPPPAASPGHPSQAAAPSRHSTARCGSAWASGPSAPGYDPVWGGKRLSFLRRQQKSWVVSGIFGGDWSARVGVLEGVFGFQMELFEAFQLIWSFLSFWG